jgi:YesN/AraC family two-component response regulator
MFKLLIVEDEVNSRKGLQDLISSMGNNLSITTAVDGQEGLHKAIIDPPDIIITDIKMPKLNGIEMIKQLRAQGISSRIFILSGYAEFEYAKAALTLGVSDYILKPVVPSQVFALLNDTLRLLKEEKKEFHPYKQQKLILLSEDDNACVADFYKTTAEEYYLCAAVYMGKMRHLTDKVKDSLLENSCLTIVNLPNKHYRGILIPIKKNQRNSAAKILQMNLNRQQGLVCIYDIVKTAEPINWFSHFEFLCSRILYNITNGETFFQYVDSMDKEPVTVFNDASFKKELKKLYFTKDYPKCCLLIEKQIETLRQMRVHPNKIITFAASSLYRLDTDTMEQISTELRHMQYVKQVMSAVTLQEIHQCLREYFYDETGQGDDASLNAYSKPIQAAIREIREHYHLPLTLNSTAERINITPQYLSRLFSAETGKTFIDYLTDYRMEKGKHLLRHTDKKVYEIAALIGYPDVKYYCTLFKKVVGISPNQYRSSER